MCVLCVHAAVALTSRHLLAMMVGGWGHGISRSRASWGKFTGCGGAEGTTGAESGRTDALGGGEGDWFGAG